MGTATRQPTSATLPKVAAGFKPSIPLRARYYNGARRRTGPSAGATSPI